MVTKAESGPNLNSQQYSFRNSCGVLLYKIVDILSLIIYSARAKTTQLRRVLAQGIAGFSRRSAAGGWPSTVSDSTWRRTGRLEADENRRVRCPGDSLATRRAVSIVLCDQCSRRDQRITRFSKEDPKDQQNGHRNCKAPAKTNPGKMKDGKRDQIKWKCLCGSGIRGSRSRKSQVALRTDDRAQTHHSCTASDAKSGSRITGHPTIAY